MGTDPRRIGDVLSPYLESLGMPDIGSVVDLHESWAEVAGEPWAEWSDPVIIEGDVLIVRARSASVIRPLRYGVGDLVRRCDERLGVGIVTSVRVAPPD